jgi:predicted CXXCH cytochrome family protein
MRTRWLWPWLLAALLPLMVHASDAPHDASQGKSCTSCHIAHNALGGALTTTAGNANLCFSCHTTTSFGFPWVNSDQGVPGGNGNSHRWGSPAVNAEHDAQLPAFSDIANVINNNGGNLICSACHDQHTGAGKVVAKGGSAAATQHLSAVAKTPNTGTGAVTVAAPAAAAAAKGYLIEIVASGAPGTATFRLSNDNATSWWGWSGTAWVAYAGNPRTTPATGTVALNDGTNVAVSFSGTLAAGERYSFYVSYPMLRLDTLTNTVNSSNDLCEQCHLMRVMTTARVEGTDPAYLPDGTRKFSHPVGVALANAYDRTVATNGPILDANGGGQGTPQADAIRTNDLMLFGAGNAVRCLSCHYVHNATSNSLDTIPK